MRIIKLESVDIPYDFKVWNVLPMHARALRGFKTPFEETVIAALQAVDGENGFSLTAGIPIQEATENGLWTTNYSPQIQVFIGQPIFHDSLYVWLEWSEANKRTGDYGKLYHAHLLSRTSFFQIYEQYHRLTEEDTGEELEAFLITELARFLRQVCVNNGIENRIRHFNRLIAEHFVEMRRAEELRSELLSFHDPSKR